MRIAHVPGPGRSRRRPAAATEVISFEEVPAQNSQPVTLCEEYAHLGVHFSSIDDGAIWDGMSNGDAGGWGLEGTNGPTFVGFNGGSDRLDRALRRAGARVPVDVAAASGGERAARSRSRATARARWSKQRA